MIGVYRNLSRTALDVEKSKAFLEMRKFRVQLYKSTILKPYFENIPTIDLGIFSGLITFKISSLVVSLCIPICVPTPEMKSHTLFYIP